MCNGLSFVCNGLLSFLVFRLENLLGFLGQFICIFYFGGLIFLLYEFICVWGIISLAVLPCLWFVVCVCTFLLMLFINFFSVLFFFFFFLLFLGKLLSDEIFFGQDLSRFFLLPFCSFLPIVLIGIVAFLWGRVPWFL